MDIIVINSLKSLPSRSRYRLIKRVGDYLICLLAMPIVLPVMAICALAIWLDSPGPMLFVQERIGKGGRQFKMLKFRTMQHNLDDREHRVFMKAFVNGQVNGVSGHQMFKPVQAAQVTRVGRILRKTSLDELPQLFNVLRGEMSIIGPRPNVPWEVEEYRLWHHERLEVLPGITGLAQVMGRSGLPFDRIAKYDAEYVMKQSFGLDLKIMLWTVKSVLMGRGAG